MLVFPNSISKLSANQSQSGNNDHIKRIEINPSSPINISNHPSSDSMTTSNPEEFGNCPFHPPYYTDTELVLENNHAYEDFLIASSSPFQLDCEHLHNNWDEVASNSTLPFPINCDRSSSREINEYGKNFKPICPSRHNCHSHYFENFPSCTCIFSNSSSILPSEESTPLFAPFITSAENTTATPIFPSSGNSSIEFPLEANTIPSILEKSNSEDAIFSEQLEFLMEYVTSPLSKCKSKSTDCWLDFRGEYNSQVREKEFIQEVAPSGPSNRSKNYAVIPNYHSQNQIGRHFSNILPSTDGRFRYIPWLRTINRNMLYNQLHQNQNTYRSQNSLELKQAPKRSRHKQENKEMLTNNNSSNSNEIIKELQTSLEDVFDDDKNIWPVDRNNAEDPDYQPQECDSEDEEYSDYDASDDDSEDWIYPPSRRPRKRKISSCADPLPQAKRIKKNEKKTDSINDVEEDSDNEVDANDPNASLQPRRKASESARNILMNWLVENEDHPYPTKKQKLDLAAATGLSLKQIVHWMSNIRKRRMIPLLSGRRKPSSAVDVKFIDDIHRRRAMLLSKRK